MHICTLPIHIYLLIFSQSLHFTRTVIVARSITRLAIPTWSWACSILGWRRSLLSWQFKLGLMHVVCWTWKPCKRMKCFIILSNHYLITMFPSYMNSLRKVQQSKWLLCTPLDKNLYLQRGYKSRPRIEKNLKTFWTFSMAIYLLYIETYHNLNHICHFSSIFHFRNRELTTLMGPQLATAGL